MTTAHHYLSSLVRGGKETLNCPPRGQKPQQVCSGSQAETDLHYCLATLDFYMGFFRHKRGRNL